MCSILVSIMKAILVCVDYGDILALTLPYNRHHFHKMVVVTTPQDAETRKVATDNYCMVHETESFYKDGAAFNKWLALEEGLDILGRSGWITIMDADILWPKVAPLNDLKEDTIYSPRRYMNPEYTVPPENIWHTFPMHPVGHIWAGYTQIFHASAAGPVPWHMSHHTCGGPDTVFQNRWKNKVRTSWNCLHLGPTETNWCGRIVPKIDGTPMNRFVDTKVMMEEHRRNFSNLGG